MKTLALFFCVYLLAYSNTFGQGFEKIKDSEVGNQKIEIAKKFANDFFTAQKNNSSFQFKDEAIDAVKNSLTPERQQAIYKNLRDNFGDYKSCEYAETWIQKGNPDLKILRLKGEFDKSNKKLEIRVVLNEHNKIAGFFIKPWSDMLM
jgi:hypothetical protein